MSLVSLAVRPIWADQTWNLVAAGRVLDGGALGFEDVAKVNPPLLDIPVTAAMQGKGDRTGRILGHLVDHPAAAPRRRQVLRGLVRARAAVATVVHPWPDYAQREHIVLPH